MATADKTTNTEIMTGASIIVEALIRNGTQVVFAYPGGCSMPLHQALLEKKDVLRTILPRHEQGGGFAAQGVARATGRAGVCIATSGPGATNLVTAIADAKLDSIPMVALTAQVPTAVIGTDAFQETPMVEICRGITKHHYLVTRVEELARVVREAFHVATTGRPGPVLIDIPKDVQLDQCAVDWDEKMNLPGYRATVNPDSPVEQIKQVAAAIKHARRPLIYAGGGIVHGEATEELRELVATTGIPTTLTLMGL
ncbi:MAG: thiamine pyrophosphate-binding protein, partial [Pirellulaceae bacterium]